MSPANDNDAFTRWNRARSRQELWDRLVDYMKMAGLLILAIYVIWDVSYYEPDAEITSNFINQP